MNNELLKKTSLVMLVVWSFSNPTQLLAEVKADTDDTIEAASAISESAAGAEESTPADEAAAEDPEVEKSPEPAKIEDELSATFDEAVPEKPIVQSTHSDKKKRNEVPLEAGDRLKIKIYPEDDYIKGGDMQISSEGNITLPLVGKVQVAGKTSIEAEREIVAIIDKDFLVNPEVVIEVMTRGETAAKRSVIVFGQVRKPGPYDFPSDKKRMTLLEVISLAGGFTEIANFKKIKIVRKAEGDKKVINANGEAIMSGKDPDIELVNGDVVTVSESLF